MCIIKELASFSWQGTWVGLSKKELLRVGCKLGLGVALPYYKHRDMYLMCKNNSLSG